MSEPPDATDDAGTVVFTAGHLGDGMTLLKEPPVRGTPTGLHDFALIRQAPDEEALDAALHEANRTLVRMLREQHDIEGTLARIKAARRTGLSTDTVGEH